MDRTCDVRVRDGRMLRVHDTADSAGLTVLWHPPSPHTGRLLAPLVAAARARGIRVLSYARPSYGGSTPNPGRDVASAASDVEAIVDELGIDRFAVMGASGGGPHALACAALLPDRVIAVVTLAGMAAFTDSFDWYAGMQAPGGLRAAEHGRAARVRYADSAQFDPESFTDADYAALQGPWKALGADAGAAQQLGPDGLTDDDLAFVHPWGFHVGQLTAPVLVVQGGADRIAPPSHGEWLVRECPTAQLWLRPRDGHISVLNACPVALDWVQNARTGAH